MAHESSGREAEEREGVISRAGMCRAVRDLRMGSGEMEQDRVRSAEVAVRPLSLNSGVAYFRPARSRNDPLVLDQ